MKLTWTIDKSLNWKLIFALGFAIFTNELEILLQ